MHWNHNLSLLLVEHVSGSGFIFQPCGSFLNFFRQVSDFPSFVLLFHVISFLLFCVIYSIFWPCGTKSICFLILLSLPIITAFCYKFQPCGSYFYFFRQVFPFPSSNVISFLSGAYFIQFSGHKEQTPSVFSYSSPSQIITAFCSIFLSIYVLYSIKGTSFYFQATINFQCLIYI